MIFKTLNVKSQTWCVSQRKRRGARLQVLSGHPCPGTGEKTVLPGLESGFRRSALCLGQTLSRGRERIRPCCVSRSGVRRRAGDGGLTLPSFTLRITLCLRQSPVYPDPKQLERPNYQMLCFPFLLLNTQHSAFGSPDKERR